MDNLNEMKKCLDEDIIMAQVYLHLPFLYREATNCMIHISSVVLPRGGDPAASSKLGHGHT